MKRYRFIAIVLAALSGEALYAFDFEVECDDEIARDLSVADYFQHYTGNWVGEWEEDETLRFLPDRIKRVAARFRYHESFRVEVSAIKGCKVALTVYYEPDTNDFTVYREEIMTAEGLYIYWNSPTIEATYILIYEEERDVLSGTLQLFEGQNIASIEMRRL